MDLRKLVRLFYQLKIVNQETTSRFEKEVGFSLTRYELLMSLKENGKCLQNQLQENLKIDFAAISRHLKLLEEKGYVMRERNSQNNREVFVSLSKKAVQEITHCEREFQEADTALNIGLSDEETEQLSNLLSKLLIKKEDIDGTSSSNE
ncbi:MarR family winged helix-turn-helix transcriptional regulator [Lactococcus nasutitermitis]|uniref:MarR family winged helix-turn-helix transcriptional regulator n=1 Tax=Lactococcus nasutitermitis TaxID=1652957 RepID=A0ABV9JBV0_9LACT|nr:MarR family transcriptional regulator [Lactococcus nasutitermitis]